MLKKIFAGIFVIVSFILITSPFKAQNTEMMLKDKIYLIGTDVEYQNDLRLVSTNVDKNRTGTYFATYTDDKYNYIEKIIITSLDELQKGIGETKLLLDKEVEEFDIMKGISYQNAIYLLCRNHYYYFVTKISDRIEYSDELLRCTNGSITDITIDEEKEMLVYVGTYSNDTLDIYVGNMNLNLKTFKKRYIVGSDMDTGRYITSFNGVSYIAGETNSNDGIFSHDKNGSDTYVISLDSGNLQIKDYYDLGERNNETVSLFKRCGDYFYLIKSYSNDLYVETSITRFDIDFNELEKNYLPTCYPITIVNETSLGDTLYLNYKTIDQEKNQCYKYENNKLLKYAEDLDFITIDLNNIFTIDNDNLILNYNDNNISYQIESDISNLMVVGSKIIYLKDHHLKCFDYDYILSLDTKIDLTPLNDKTGKIKYLDDSITFINQNHFGNYPIRLHYETLLFDVIIKKDINVKLDTSIMNENTYTTGLLLTFNGLCNINGERIDSGYIINDVGRYKIDFEDVNHNITTYYINIENMELESINMMDNPKISSTNYQNINNDNLVINQEATANKIIEKNYNSSLWYILIPSSICLLGVTLYLTIGKKVL